MNIDFFDGLLSLLAMVGVWPVMIRLFRDPSPNPIEVRLRAILLLTFIFLGTRFPYMGLNMRELGPLVFALAIILSFSTFLFFETLLRRHMPMWMKILLSFGSLYFIGLALLAGLDRDPESLMYFAGFLVISQLSTVTVCLVRDRSCYSSSENRFIDVCVVSLLFLVPFYLSDMTEMIQTPLPRLGVIGALLFTYFSLSTESIFQRKGYVLLRLLRAFVIAVILTWMATSLHPTLIEGRDRIFILFFSVIMIFKIYDTVKWMDGRDPFSKFVSEALELDKRDRAKFLEQLATLFRKINMRILSDEEVKDYPISHWIELFELRQTTTLSIYELRELLTRQDLRGSYSNEQLETSEQMIRLMERNGTDALSVIPWSQPVFVLFEVTLAGYLSQVRMQVDLVSQMGSLFDVLHAQKVSDALKKFEE